MNRHVLLVVLAIVAFVLAIVVSESGDELLLNAVSWLAVGGGLFAASTLP